MIIESKRVQDIVDQLEIIGKMASEVIREWQVENELFVSVVPNYCGDGIQLVWLVTLLDLKASCKLSTLTLML
jgi:hypothetical protein